MAKKITTLFLTTVFFLSIFVTAASAQMPVNHLNEPGSILVFPYVDNINNFYNTVLTITNTAPYSVYLEGHAITHGPGQDPCFDLLYLDFRIELSAFETLTWDTGVPSGGGLPNLANREGYIFLFAIDSPTMALEINHNHLIGSAKINQYAEYNAVPFQALTITQDRRLDLDGVEYTAATSTVMSPFAAYPSWGLSPKLALASLDMDFIMSDFPNFDINLGVWNMNQNFQSDHFEHCPYGVYDHNDIGAFNLANLFTPIGYFKTSSTNPMVGVMLHDGGGGPPGVCMATNLWQHPDYGVAAIVVLPIVP
jgi:hypothetical protein